MINGVEVKKLVVYTDERGRLMEILRNDDPLFKSFGQVYYTTCSPGFTKAWHYHKIQTDHFTCISGSMRLVLYDDRAGSKTKGKIQEFIINQKNPIVVSIPPGVYHGFEAVGDVEAIAINVPTHHYDPKEPDEFRLPFNTEKIDYKWSGKVGW